MHFVTRWKDEIIAIANIVIALGTVVLALGIPWSLLRAAREDRSTFYATLDKTYFDIQKLIIDWPHLSQPDLTGKSASEVVQYDAFSFMTWNFVESIYDYSKDDKSLHETWHCILRFEAHLHRVWFNKPENRTKFKKLFVDYILHEGCAPCGDESSLQSTPSTQDPSSS